ncbi:type II toxin-antitoxin system PemK/MazF family toxin [Limosilactobacillus fermentum]
MEVHQGDIVWVNLDPTKGPEPKKICPCLVVSNDNYNQVFN